MGFIDELKKLTHPYEDEDEEFEEFEETPRRDTFEDRRNKPEDRRKTSPKLSSVPGLRRGRRWSII